MSHLPHLRRRILDARPSVAQLWSVLRPLPGGPLAFSKLVGALAPYTGTIDPLVRELESGHAEILLRDRRSVRNHLDSIHAVALMNLGEVATGLAVLYAVDGRGRGIITSLSMDFLKKARGDITATCDTTIPTRPGEHDVSAEAILRDAGGVVVARARAVWRVSIGQ